MCLGIPGELVGTVEDHIDLAMVDVSGVRRRINVGLLADEDLKVGDWVLVHVGFALSKISESEAKAVLDLLEDLGQPYFDEIDALRESVVPEAGPGSRENTGVSETGLGPSEDAAISAAGVRPPESPM